MPSEAHLKAIMQAAIAKKKQSDATRSTSHESKQSEVSKSTTQSIPHKSPAKSTTITENTSSSVPEAPKTGSTTTPPAKSTAVPEVQSSQADWTRTFYGRPIRLAVSQKQIYYAVSDILDLATQSSNQNSGSSPFSEDTFKKLIKPLTVLIRFPSPNGGNQPLEAATANDLVEIITKLKLTFPGPIEKWLTDTSNGLAVLIS